MVVVQSQLQQLQQQQQQNPQILGQPLEHLITPYVNYLTFGIDIAAGIIIGISAIMAFIAFLKILGEPIDQQTADKETIRLRLARGLLLALDFEVGSDILKTILLPSITVLSILAVVVSIRIVLSWSLSKEIDRHDIDLVDAGKKTVLEARKEKQEEKEKKLPRQRRRFWNKHSQSQSNTGGDDDDNDDLEADKSSH